MAKENKPPQAKKTNTAPLGADQLEIVILDQKVTVGQLYRGNSSVTKWVAALRSAESLRTPNRKYLVETIFDISIDPLISALLHKRTTAIQLSPWTWTDLTQEAVIANFQSPWFFELIEHILDVIYRGHTVIQFNVAGGFVTDTEPIPRQNVRPEDHLITYEMYGYDGFRYDLPPYDRYLLPLGKPKDFGLLAKLVPYILMKRDNLAFFMTHNELFGMPLRTYYYNPNDPTSRRATEEAAQKQGAAAYIVLPEGARVEFQQAQSGSSASSPYQVLHRLLTDEITISILGQTLTTSTEGKGSNALGRIHKDVEEAINLGDMMYVEMVINYQVRDKILLPHGYPLAGVKGAFVKTERLSQTEKLNIWDKIGQYHAPIDFAAWYAEFGVPHPQDQASIDRFIHKRTATAPAAPVPLSFRQSMASQLTALYSRYRPTVQLSSDALEKEWERVMGLVHAQTVSTGYVDPALYTLLAEMLWKGVREGLGTALPTLDAELVAQLRDNIYVFSGFKTYQQLRDASALLLDGAGGIRPFADFLREVRAVYNQYNVAWLQSEYNMAVANAQAAAQWQRIEAEKDTLPWLSFSSVRDDVARHLTYDGITRKVDDPVWNYLTPPLDWGCRCTLRQLADASATPANQIPQQELVRDLFAFNPGKQKVIFPRNHPYYQVQSGDEKSAANFFGLPRPDANDPL